MNEARFYMSLQNRRIPPFFKFGTPPAGCWVSEGISPEETDKHLKETKIMYANTANRFAAAAFSVIVSAAFFAYAIIPASPGLTA